MTRRAKIRGVRSGLRWVWNATIIEERRKNISPSPSWVPVLVKQCSSWEEARDWVLSRLRPILWPLDG